MNIRQINYILAVNELQSFGKAAEKCFVTQSTLSTMVSKFENELGIKIFDRNTKPITTTQEGKVILQQLRIIVQELDNLNEVVNELKGEISGQVRIGVIPTIAPYLLPLFLTTLIQKHPKIQFVISEITTDQIINDLENRDLDIGILSTPLAQPNLKETILYTEPFLLYDGSSKQSAVPISANQIDCNRLWLLREGHCLRTQVETICDLQTKQNLELNLEYKSGSIDTLMKFVKKNKGVTLLPYLATIDYSKEEQQFLRVIAPPQPARIVSLVVHKHFVKKAMLDSLKSAIQEAVEPLFSQKEKKEWLVSPV